MAAAAAHHRTPTAITIHTPPSPSTPLYTLVTTTPPSPSRQPQQRWLFQPLPPSGCPPPNHHRGGGRTTVHHHSRTLWCRAVMAQPLGVSHSGQPPKTTDVVAAEPTLNITAAPCGVGLVVNNHFFWVDDFACPVSFPWHTTKHVIRDHDPVVADFNAQDYATLVAHPSPFQKFLEAFLCLVRLSLHYTLDEETYHWFLHKNREGGCLLGLEASVEKLFDEGGSGNQTGQGILQGVVQTLTSSHLLRLRTLFLRTRPLCNQDVKGKGNLVLWMQAGFPILPKS
uniref:Uncharacterized protein n=1 Tax=Tanacetum cinerariifolium TaxID=118510 RepID=A0A6L2LFG7_TANCI|nr:hypothetical protein [Tanacetum cinerariifolium]